MVHLLLTLMLNPGDPAPDFTAMTDDGSRLTLSELRGTPVVLFFYPKDDTPG
jgi:peroxiredoxin Q/BCP